MNPEKFNEEKISINNIQHRISSIKSRVTKQEKILSYNLKELSKQKEELENIENSGYVEDDNGDIISIADSKRDIAQELRYVKENIMDIKKEQEKLLNRSLKLLQIKERSVMPIMEYCVYIFDKITRIFKTYNQEESSKLDKSLNKFFDSLPKRKQPSQQSRQNIISFFKKNYDNIKQAYNKNIQEKAKKYIENKKYHLDKKTGKDAAAGE